MYILLPKQNRDRVAEMKIKIQKEKKNRRRSINLKKIHDYNCNMNERHPKFAYKIGEFR